MKLNFCTARDFIVNSHDSVPDKRGVSGHKPEKAGHLTQKNK